MKKFIAEAIVVPAVKAMLPTIEKVIERQLETFMTEALPTIVEASIRAVLPDALDGLVPDLNRIVKEALAGNLPAVINEILNVPGNFFKGFLK